MNDTVFYIVVFVIIAHFIVGFIFLARKLSGPVREEPWEDEPEEREENETVSSTSGQL
jgi:hypothetical protein